MKQLLAISLLIIHLFNLSGYAFVFQYLQHRSDAQLAQQIEKGSYNRSTLTILKVPMQLPYGNDWAEFERVDGAIEIDGVHYTYVERKISRDTVYLACLPNEGRAKLSKAKTDFAQAVNTIPESKQKQNELSKKGLFGLEYSDPSYYYQFATAATAAISQSSFLLFHAAPIYLPAPFSPPDLA